MRARILEDSWIGWPKTFLDFAALRAVSEMDVLRGQLECRVFFWSSLLGLEVVLGFYRFAHDCSVGEGVKVVESGGNLRERGC
jgi:hypothetical protein